MTIMHLSLSEALRAFVDAQAADRGLDTADAYVLELIEREEGRARLRAMLLDGINSGPGRVVDADYFEELHSRARGDAAE